LLGEDKMTMEGMSRDTFNMRYNYRCDPNGEKHCKNCIHSGWDCGLIYRVGPEQCNLLRQCGARNQNVELNSGLCDLWQLKKVME
jgi:hypothetical protein